MLHWTKQQAREFIVNYQMINTKTNESIDSVFNRIHMIQYDPLNVVGTNPDLVLQARIKKYQPIMLDTALYQDRSLIDGWDKQMSIYQTKDYPRFARIREERSELSLRGALTYLKMDATPYIDDVYSIVKEQGPIFSSEIKRGESKKHKWGHTKPSTVAIDYLFHKGDLGIAERKNTQKRYDLIERLIPQYLSNDPFETEKQFLLWYLNRRIETVGLAWSKSTSQYLSPYIKKKTVRNKILPQLIENGSITEVDIEGINGEFYIPTSALDLPKTLMDSITFIAPLDALVWDRELLRQLFDFDYIWEVYTPKAKRQYGYYVLPILRKATMIGRIEFEPQRETNPLRIQSLVLEPSVTQSNTLQTKLNTALKRFASYVGASAIEHEIEWLS